MPFSLNLCCYFIYAFFFLRFETDSGFVDSLVWENRIGKMLEVFKPCTEIKEDPTSSYAIQF